MKKIIFLLMAIIFGSCATSRKMVVSHEALKEHTDSSENTNERSFFVYDTTHVSNRKIRITKIEFFDPDRNRKEHKDSAMRQNRTDQDVSEDNDQSSPVRRSFRDGSGRQVKSISVIEVAESDSSNVRKAENVAKNQQTSVKRKVDRKTKNKAVTATKKGLMTTKDWIVVVLFIISFVYCWLKLKK